MDYSLTEGRKTLAAMPFTDLRPAHWLMQHLPEKLRPYALLARWDRPIGVWLLLLPGWWSIALAASGLPDLRLCALFVLGAIAMRGAGCTLNDIVDRKLDAQVERTRGRPLPGGLVTLRQAIAFLAVQLVVGLLILLQLPFPAIILGAASLLPIAVYPFMKRVTWLPQFILGLTFNWGALLGWVAVTGSMEAPAFLLYCGAVLWTMVYDTIYAHQDAGDDAVIGVKSAALLFGAWSRPVLLGFACLSLAFFALAGYAAQAAAGFYIGLAVAAAHWLWQLAAWKINDPADCLLRFRRSRDFGFLMLLAIVAGKI